MRTSIARGIELAFPPDTYSSSFSLAAGYDMGIRGFIELPPDLDRERVQEIIDAAHRVTGAGKVILILSDVPVEEPLLSQARDAELVIADSERLSAALLSSGILHMRAEEGLFYLRSLAPGEEESPLTVDNPSSGM